MPHLDFTIDLETCGLGTCAAPLQLAAVAWQRTTPLADGSPFLRDIDAIIPGTTDEHCCISPTFNAAIDLRDCFFLGLDIDADTQQWWMRQKPEARLAVLEASRPLSLADTLRDFDTWFRALRTALGADSMTLWAQGSDFDIAKLREYYRRCGLKEPFAYTEVRCARTYLLEHAHLFADPAEALRAPKTVYDHIPAMPSDICQSVTHDALYDCYKTSWSVWQVYQKELGVRSSQP